MVWLKGKATAREMDEESGQGDGLHMLWVESRDVSAMRKGLATGNCAVGTNVVCFLSFLFLFCSFGDEPRSKQWELEVAGSTYGGRGFGPCSCSYPRGGLKIKQNHHHHGSTICVFVCVMLGCVFLTI